MVKEYQVTLMCKDGKYRPVSCLIKCEELDLLNKEQKKDLIKKGTQKICLKRYWTGSDLVKYGYTKAKVRLYDEEKIAEDAKLRYTAIKEAHYADGRWKRPKEK